MALSDWIQKITGSGGLTVSIDVSTPIVGSGSLLYTFDASSTTSAINMYLDPGTFTIGLTKGRIRTLLKIANSPTAATVYSAGILCLQSALDVSSTSGSCYSVEWGRVDGSTGLVRVLKRTSGISNPTTGVTVLYSASLAANAAKMYPIQLEWDVDVANLGGTRLTFSLGTADSTDFSTLATQYDAVQTSSPLTTSVAEGILGLRNTNSTNPHWEFDETSVYQLT